MRSSADVIKKDEFTELYRASGDEGRYSSAESRVRELEERIRELEAEAERRVQAASRDARRTAEAEAEERLAAATAALQSVAERLNATLEAERSIVETDLVHLACAVAGKIVRREIAQDDTFVTRLVQRCLRKIVDRSAILIRVNEEDHARVAEVLDAAVAEGAQPVRIVEDRRVERGGCIVETPDFVVDGNITTQLAAARDAMVGETA
ncbi:MAG: hypothetical protein HKN12_05690 [Gemmatimonadetes bacterium]|nr:hypothetical protein [Gemmatimonadota bacterium]